MRTNPSCRGFDVHVAVMAEDEPTFIVRCQYDYRKPGTSRSLRLRLVKAAVSQPVASDAFQAYYEHQRILPPGELPLLVAALGRPLPLDVRVGARAPLSGRAMQHLCAGRSRCATLALVA